MVVLQIQCPICGSPLEPKINKTYQTGVDGKKYEIKRKYLVCTNEQCDASRGGMTQAQMKKQAFG